MPKDNIKKIPEHELLHRMISHEDGIVSFREGTGEKGEQGLVDKFEEGVYSHFKELPLEKIGSKFGDKEKRSTQYDYKLEDGKQAKANAYIGNATTNAISVCDGKIVGIETGSMGHNKLWLQPENNLRTYLYETLRDAPRFKEGDFVQAGTKFGLIGTPDQSKLIFKVFRRDAYATGEDKDLKEQIIQKAKEKGFPEQIALATAEIESNLNPSSGGKKAAYGLMGLMSKWAAGFDDRFTEDDITGNPKKLYDLDLNLTIGALKLKGLWDKYGNLCDVRCAYYSGANFGKVKETYKDKSAKGIMPNDKQTVKHVIVKTIPRMFRYTKKYEKEYSLSSLKKFANAEQKKEFEQIYKELAKKDFKA